MIKSDNEGGNRSNLPARVAQKSWTELTSPGYQRQPATSAGAPSASVSSPAPVSRVSPSELDSLKRLFHTTLPSNRTLRADFVRYFLLNARPERRALLARVGIIVEVAKGDYNCERALDVDSANE